MNTTATAATPIRSPIQDLNALAARAPEIGKDVAEFLQTFTSGTEPDRKSMLAVLQAFNALAAPRVALPTTQAETPSPFSTTLAEAALRAEGRIQDDLAALRKLGYSSDELPAISPQLIEEAARTSGTLVLRFPTAIADYQARLNSTLGDGKLNLHLYVDEAAKNLATIGDAEWINVPNTVRSDTLKLSKTAALASISGSQTSDPMDTVLLLGYNNLTKGEQLPGFRNKWTFTDREDTLVGSHARGIDVDVRGRSYDFVNSHVGLAPRFAPESKNR